MTSPLVEIGSVEYRKRKGKGKKTKLITHGKKRGGEISYSREVNTLGGGGEGRK